MIADLTADDLTTGIANALRAHDIEAVEDMLQALASLDPRRAQAVYDTLQVGVAIGRARAIPDADNLDAALKKLRRKLIEAIPLEPKTRRLYGR